MTTRERLVEAALACVDEQGWPATHLATVRTRAGVSNGSLYHFFPTRAALAAAVSGAIVAERHGAYLAVLREAPSAADGVMGLVREFQRWVAAKPEHARLVVGSREALRAIVDDSAVEAHGEFLRETGRWLAGHGWTGTPPFPVVQAMWIGPIQDYALAWLAFPDHHELVESTESLALAAWRSIEPLLDGRGDAPPSRTGNGVSRAT